MNTPQRTYINGVINCSGSGDNTIINAVTGKKIVVMNYFFTVASSVVATWKRGSTAISGPMTLTVGASPGGSESVLSTNAGEALILNLSSGVQASGHLTYYEE